MPKFKILNANYETLTDPTYPTVGPFDTIFADPPDNIKLDYDEYDDQMQEDQYHLFLEALVKRCIQLAKTTYISFNARWMTNMGAILAGPFNKHVKARWLIQGFTFGQHNHHDHGNNFRPIIRLTREDAEKFPDEIRVESWRMKNGDKRANPKGRVPGDVWFSDFLDYARVTGNSKQRRRWHPTQLHEGLVEDCLLMSTPEGGRVFDPFCGTGTTLRVCLANGWSCTTVDISENYCQKVAEENEIPRVAEDLWYRED